MMIGQEDILNKLDPEEASQEDPEETSQEDPEEASQEDPEEASQEDPEEASQEDPEETSQESITLSLDDVGMDQSLDSLGLYGITCIVIIYFLGILTILKRRD